MKKTIFTTIMAVVAGVLCFTGCKPEYTTYSGPNYILFSDTLYEMAVVDDETFFDLPIVATQACDYDRNVAVESGNYTEEELNAIRADARDAQFYWDFVFVENSEGAHNSQLTKQCLDKAETLVNRAMSLF